MVRFNRRDRKSYEKAFAEFSYYGKIDPGSSYSYPIIFPGAIPFGRSRPHFSRSIHYGLL